MRCSGRHADVGGQEKREAAGQAMAVDGGDHRLPDFEPAIEQRQFLRQPEFLRFTRAPDEALQIGAAAECLFSRACDDRAAYGRVVTTTPHFTDSTDKRTTVSAVTEGDWNRAIAALHGKASPRPWRWLDAHFASSAFMLTHAMFRSGF